MWAISRLAYGVLLPVMRATLGGSYALYGTIGAANLGGYLAGTLAATRLARSHVGRDGGLRLRGGFLGPIMVALKDSFPQRRQDEFDR